MKKYELAVVLSTKAVENEAHAAEPAAEEQQETAQKYTENATIEEIKALITRFGGTNIEVNAWGKKRLAYEIQKMKEGYYYFITFEAEPTCPPEIEQRIRIMENVIRYLCIRQDD